MRVLEALDVVPGEPGLVVEAGRALAPRLDEAPGEVALAPAVGGGVDRQAEARVAVADRALHVVVHEARRRRGRRAGRCGSCRPPWPPPPGPGCTRSDSICGTPNSAEASAAVAPPPGVKLSIEPMGAIITGMRTGLPRNSSGVHLRDVAQHARAEGQGVDGPDDCGGAWSRSRCRRSGSPTAPGPGCARGADDLVKRLEPVFQARSHGAQHTRSSRIVRQWSGRYRCPSGRSSR